MIATLSKIYLDRRWRLSINQSGFISDRNVHSK